MIWVSLSLVWDPSRPILPPLGAIANLAGLELQIRKSVIVPLWGGFIPTAQFLTRRLISSLTPEWKDLQIAAYARYLGVLIGPAVMLDIQWKAAFDKYWLRVVQLAASAPGPSVATKLSSTCVITCHHSRLLPHPVFSTSRHVPSL